MVSCRRSREKSGRSLTVENSNAHTFSRYSGHRILHWPIAARMTDANCEVGAKPTYQTESLSYRFDPACRCEIVVDAFAREKFLHQHYIRSEGNNDSPFPVVKPQFKIMPVRIIRK